MHNSVWVMFFFHWPRTCWSTWIINIHWSYNSWWLLTNLRTSDNIRHHRSCVTSILKKSWMPQVTTSLPKWMLTLHHKFRNIQLWNIRSDPDINNQNIFEKNAFRISATSFRGQCATRNAIFSHVDQYITISTARVTCTYTITPGAPLTNMDLF